jgi:hypothetical protein
MPAPNAAHERVLCRLIGELTKLIATHGPLTEPVREHIKLHSRVPEYRSLAITYLYLCTEPKEVQAAIRRDRWRWWLRMPSRVLSWVRRRLRWPPSQRSAAETKT